MSASTLSRSGTDRPLLHELALERPRGALADVDGAARAERPAPGPLREPRRAPAREPAPVVRARDTERRDRPGGVARHEAQRPAQRLQVELQASVDLAEVDEPCRETVVARGSAAPEGLDGEVGLGGRLRRRHEVLIRPARDDVLRRPGAAGEDVGLRDDGHASAEYGPRVGGYPV